MFLCFLFVSTYVQRGAAFIEYIEIIFKNNKR